MPVLQLCKQDAMSTSNVLCRGVALHGCPGRSSSLQPKADVLPVCLQISAAFSGGSAIAVLAGGMLFCRYTGAGRRNFITALAALAASCFFILTK